MEFVLEFSSLICFICFGGLIALHEKSSIPSKWIDKSEKSNSKYKSLLANIILYSWVLITLVLMFGSIPPIYE